MVSFPLSEPLVKIELPTREELRAMLNRPAIAITLAICATLVVLAAIGGVIFLVYTGKDSSAIGILLAGVLAAVGTLWNRRLSSVQQDVATIKEQQQAKDS